jgi:ABC-2 type transport system ATP-binding protein
MIECQSVVKRYDGFTALDGVSFDHKAGIFGIIGHNGAGKTTLLKILAGLIKPTSGEVVVGGIDVVIRPQQLKAMLGYLPEESRLYESMTVEAYLSFFGEIYGMKHTVISERAGMLLEALSLQPEQKKIGELSKGMKRKVAIARSLIHDPEILVYDEPTSGLDPMTSRSIAEYMKRLSRDEQKTIALSAHNLYQVEEICDRVMILRRGRCVALGSMEELRERFGSISYTVEFSIGDPSCLEGMIEFSGEGGLFTTIVHDIDALGEITACIAGEGGRIRRIESKYPTLEEMLIKVGR